MARILVLDEHAVYRRGLCALISTQMPQAQVHAAKSRIEALAQIQEGIFDLVLLGLDLSNSETVDMLKVAREASAATRFAIISASDTRADIVAALAAGSHGFISKHQSDADILDAIAHLLSGRIYVPRSLAEAGDREASASRGDTGAAPLLSTEADLSKLTKRQREVLQLLARGMSNKEIARALKIAEATTKYTWPRCCARSARATVPRPPTKQATSSIRPGRPIPRAVARSPNTLDVRRIFTKNPNWVAVTTMSSFMRSDLLELNGEEQRALPLDEHKARFPDLLTQSLAGCSLDLTSSLHLPGSWLRDEEDAR